MIYLLLGLVLIMDGLMIWFLVVPSMRKSAAITKSGKDLK